MKDTYWLVIVCLAVGGLAFWFAIFSARRRAEAFLASGAPRKEEKSIWTRDLLDNPIGRTLRSVVFPPLIIAWGLFEILTQKARVKRFDYHGFDAVCIGIGTMCAGMGLLASYALPARSPKEVRIRTVAIGTAATGFVVFFATALLRNI